LYPRSQLMNSNLQKISILLLVMGLFGCVKPVEVVKSPVSVGPGEQLLAAGVQSFTIGDYTAAMQYFKGALAVGRGVDDDRGVVLAEVNMAETALGMGDLSQVRNHLLEAQRLVEQRGVEGFASRLEMISANLAIREGRGDVGISILAPYLTNTNGLHGNNDYSDEYRLAALISRTELAFTDDDEENDQYWVALYRQVFADSAISNISYKARLLRFEARLAHLAQKRMERDKFLAQAMKIYREGLTRPGLAALLVEWGRYLAEDEDRNGARDLFNRAFFVRVQMRDRYGCEQVLSLLEALDAADGEDVGPRLEETRRWRAVVNGNNPKMWGGLVEKRNPVR